MKVTEARMGRRPAIPAMFHRRLLGLGVLLVVSMGLPALRLAQLTVVRGEELRAEAEQRLVRRSWVPTSRGRILDRKGRVLAADRPCYNLAVDYRVISGDWARDQAQARAKRLHAGEWSQLSASGRRELVASYEPAFAARQERTFEELSSLTGVPLEEIIRRRGEIRDRVERMAESIWDNRRRERERELSERAGSGPESAMVSTADVAGAIREQAEAHVVLRAVPDELAFTLRRLIDEAGAARERGDVSYAGPALIGVEVVDDTTRIYPFERMSVPVDCSTFPTPIRAEDVRTVEVEGVATHVIGWMRERAYDEDFVRRPMRREDGSIDRGFYLEDDPVGASGLEASQEDRLRGLRGMRSRRLDTGATEDVAAEAGSDVRLTLDIALQARIEALFRPELGLTTVQAWHADSSGLPLGTSLNGSAVVVEVDTGDILALVSCPSFTRRTMEQTPGVVFDDRVDMPLLNRAVSQPYAPGSIVKPLVLCGAVTTGVYSLSERISCTGHFLPDQPGILRCWTYRPQYGMTTHDARLGGPILADDALCVSCNIFFYEMGKRLGPDRLVEWYRRLGVGGGAEPPATSIGLPPDAQYPGSLPPAGKGTAGEAILMAIGQGPIAWTPLHAAEAFATLGRGGVRLSSRLMEDSEQTRRDLGLDRAAVAMALKGLRRAVSERHGTGYQITIPGMDGEGNRHEPIFTVPGVTVWGKTGTAQASPLRADLDHDGEDESVRTGDHAWAVVLVGPREGEGGGEGRPRYAVSVVVDFGGSGGRVSGPLANQIIYALRDEGYLPATAGVSLVE